MPNCITKCALSLLVYRIQWQNMQCRMLICKSGRPDDSFQQSKFKIKNLDEMETLYMLKQASVVWKGQKWDRAYWPIRTPFTKKLGESEIYFKKSVHKKKLAHWILQVMVNNTQIFTRLDFRDVWDVLFSGQTIYTRWLCLEGRSHTHYSKHWNFVWLVSLWSDPMVWWEKQS